MSMVDLAAVVGVGVVVVVVVVVGMVVMSFSLEKRADGARASKVSKDDLTPYVGYVGALRFVSHALQFTYQLG